MGPPRGACFIAPCSPCTQKSMADPFVKSFLLLLICRFTRHPFLVSLPFLLACGISGKAQDPRDFLERYARESKKLEDFYENIQVGFECSWENKTADRDTKEHTDMSFKGTRPFFLLIRQEKDTGIERVDLLNKQGVFSLQKSKLATKYLVNTHSQDSEAGFRNIQITAIAPFAAYASFGRRILDTLKRPEVKITGVMKEGGRDGFEKVLFDGDEDDGEKSKGWFLFDSKNCMALHEHVENTNRRKYRFSVHYAGHSNGIPLVKNVEFSFQSVDEGSSRITWKIKEVIPGPFVESDFALENFGIKGFGTSSNLQSWFIILTVLFVIFVALAVLFRFLARYYEKKRGESGNATKTK